MEELLRAINNNITDEDEADNKYEDILNILDKNDNIDVNIRCLITGIIYKIQTDEETHYKLLTLIRDVLNNIE